MSNPTNDISKLSHTVRQVCTIGVAALVGIATLTPLSAEADETAQGCVTGQSTIAQCFPDKSLAEAVARSASATTGINIATNSTFTQKVIDNTTTVNDGGYDHPDSPTASLDGLQYLTNLGQLNLASNNITDISQLTGLTKLAVVDLSNNKIEDITPLRNHQELTSLNLGRNAITDVSALSGLTKLNELEINDNQITAFSGLETLPTMEILDASDNKVTSTKPLAGLTSLTDVKLNGNQIDDLSGLASLKAITTLEANSNKITDTSALGNLTSLTYLDLSGNSIKDLSGLSRLSALNELQLQDNQISVVTPLEELTNLTGLDLDSNAISSTDGLEKMTKLTNLNLAGNKISDISALSGLTDLTYLNLGDISQGNLVSDLKPLSQLKKLDSLNAAHNRIADLSGIEGLTGLTYLDLSSNMIVDTRPLSKLPNLSTGSLENQSRNLNESNSAGTPSANPASIQTAVAPDGSPISPTNLKPASGNYSPKTGTVTWTQLAAGNHANLSLDFSDYIRIAGGSIHFSGTITRDYLAPEARSHTVTFNSNEGSAVASQTVADGKTATQPANPKRDGYTFLGWQVAVESGQNGASGTASNNKTEYKDYNFNTPVTDDITLYANWHNDQTAYPATGSAPQHKLSLIDQVVNIAEGVVDIVGDAATAVVNGAKNIVKNTVSAIANTAKNAAQKIGHFFHLGG
ncbi:leucine-rich repeat domain-containing protein [Bifidobacterium sp. ESL0798]|uniref:leucine-rich repeat domain-containing protein n=1 Tax=Bifidobacterium sp. ESL0798 TaxID=2983235 RepID=UPI0023F91E54|nr:leucine-rich repeat domain-containing protein [Bifidobacterium sp. ESL0798]WEV73899.1 leucine-rich repeat domain-containing protein [Bifidobacterium sp. ESL0798]